MVKGNNLYYVNVEDHGVETIGNSYKIVQIQIQESALKLIELNEQYRVIALQELGFEMETASLSCLVLEHLKSREIKFF